MELLKILGAIADLAPTPGAGAEARGTNDAFRRELDSAMTRRADTPAPQPARADVEPDAPAAPTDRPSADTKPAPEQGLADEETQTGSDDDALDSAATPKGEDESASRLLAMLMGVAAGVDDGIDPASSTPPIKEAADTGAIPPQVHGELGDGKGPIAPALAPTVDTHALTAAGTALADAPPPAVDAPALQPDPQASLRPAKGRGGEALAAVSTAADGRALRADARVATLQSALLGMRRPAKGETTVTGESADADATGPMRALAPTPRPVPTPTPPMRPTTAGSSARTPEPPAAPPADAMPSQGAAATTVPAAAGEADADVASDGEGARSQTTDGAPAAPATTDTPRAHGAETLLQNGAELRAAESKAGTSTRPAGPSTPLPASLRPAELPERSVSLLRELRQNGEDNYRATLRLDPPALGKLRIEVQMDGDRSWTRLTVESHAAREQLQSELPRIRALMEQQGLGEARVEVQLRQGGGQHAQGDGQGPRYGAPAAETESGLEAARTTVWAAHDGLIDLRA